MGFTKLLLTREFDPETRRHYLGIVDAQARRLSNLLDDFLDVRRIEEGRFERAQELVDMATLLREEAQLYSQQSPKHDVAVEIDHAPLAVIGNPDRLRQVIGNLHLERDQVLAAGRRRRGQRRPAGTDPCASRCGTKAWASR